MGPGFHLVDEHYSRNVRSLRRLCVLCGFGLCSSRLMNPGKQPQRAQRIREDPQRTTTAGAYIVGWGFLRPFNNQGAILRTKSNAVAECNPDLGLPPLISHVVEITLWIRFVEIDGRRNDSGVHGTQGG